MQISDPGSNPPDPGPDPIEKLDSNRKGIRIRPDKINPNFDVNGGFDEASMT